MEVAPRDSVKLVLELAPMVPERVPMTDSLELVPVLLQMTGSRILVLELAQDTVPAVHSLELVQPLRMTGLPVLVLE